MSETAATYGMGGWPFWAVIVGLFVIVMARSHLFYWLGRSVAGGATRLAERSTPALAPAAGQRPHVEGAPAAERSALPLPHRPDDDRTGVGASVLRLAHTPGAQRGLALVHRFGPFAVTLAYLTVGVQTAVFVGSGLLRMPYPRFLVASVPGSVAWAFIWGTIGLGAFWAAARLAAASPWALAAAVLLLAAAAVAITHHRRTRR
ncbi:DedA family protein [Cellulomonas triticagri]|uniref:Uncharacterized protein n=1 Tax=Cellulomonas triticagri TaxID=2483352 RepID=A0A3M2JTZ0_9CELL|nr:hypothetical protein [Cellulomonas triticagri]RMI13628.1 hypothetical protein EBM89_03760 [Cellulomonas triticagri]